MNKNSPVQTSKQKEAMILALEANYGNVRKAAKMAKIVPSTHYRWLKEDEDYANCSENVRDISYRNVKENLIDAALRKVEKGDSSVLNKMLSIFFKYLPDEMRSISHFNNVPTRVRIKVASSPVHYAMDEETQTAVRAYYAERHLDIGTPYASPEEYERGLLE